MLRGVIGDDKFQAGIREYYRRYRDRNATSSDLQHVMEERSGSGPGLVLRPVAAPRGSPVVEGSWRYNPQAKSIEIELEQKQAGTPFRLPLEVGVSLDSAARPRIEKIELTQARQSFSLSADKEPVAVVLDPNTWLMTAHFGQVGSEPPASETADVVVTNGNIYTVNDRQPRAEAVAVKQGKIIFVGSSADAPTKYRADGTKVVDLAGKTVVPGFTDAHCHLSGVGEREMTLNLEGTTSLDDFLKRVKERVDQAKPGEWITGRGWIENVLDTAGLSHARTSTRFRRTTRSGCTRADGHGSVANSAAIRLAEISKDTPSPFGGEIMKDKQTGEPNGMFLDNAQGLIARHIPPQAGARRCPRHRPGRRRISNSVGPACTCQAAAFASWKQSSGSTAKARSSCAWTWP